MNIAELERMSEDARGMVPIKDQNDDAKSKDKSKELSLPPEASLPVDGRRSWESYANDFRRLTGQLATLHNEQTTLKAENSELRALYERLQAKRQEDRQRMAAVVSRCDALEANSAGQASRTKTAQRAVLDLEKNLLAAEEESRKIASDTAELRAQISHLQVSYVNLESAYAELRNAFIRKDEEFNELVAHAAWLKQSLDDRDVWANDAIALRDARIIELEALNGSR